MFNKAAILVALWPGIAVAQAPLSAIDWLSNSIEVTPAAVPPLDSGALGGAAAPEVTVTALESVTSDAAGLLSQSVTGFPTDLWRRSSPDDLARLMQQAGNSELPSVRALMFTLLLAEADAPVGIKRNGDFLQLRVDQLLKLGAVEQAEALMERAGIDTPQLFQRAFDASLLTGNEDARCAEIDRRPELSARYPARIFCLARRGKWSTAALVLGTAEALGVLEPDEDALLARFLDPDLFEEDDLLAFPEDPTPLEFRLFEAIGERMPTSTLPRAFAHADLRPVAGWKAQLEAAERLARAGALSENSFLGIYSARLPAASGGVWDRVEALQRFETALNRRDKQAIMRTLPDAWTRMGEVGLQVTFARLFGTRLLDIDLAGAHQRNALEVALLSPGYEEAARRLPKITPTDIMLRAAATGKMPETPPTQPRLRAIYDGFTTPPTSGMQALIDNRAIGEAILRAMAKLSQGTRSDPRQITEALSLFRAVGLEETARTVAIQLMLLETT
ncbi:hypothetical protein [Donghicola mangrovi]|uniref:hypothetical protein n=1 Tax=Donghicola mangrovi TaxID=2729614 RepID=UPI001D13BF93|nr:hypothetical protein [Donghicola mangrovi]